MSESVGVSYPNSWDMTREEVSRVVDEELDKFEDWFTSTFDGVVPLAKFERSILKTYLMWKFGRS